MNLKGKISRFMFGRYGFDELSRLITLLFYVLLIVNFFVKSYILYFVLVALMVITLLRCFSRNIYKRRKENEVYTRIRKKITNFVKLTSNRFRDKKTHIYIKCPSCKAVLRLPREKGEHSVRCPRCTNVFKTKV